MNKGLKETLIRAKDFLHYIGKGHPVRKDKAEEISQEIVMHLMTDQSNEKEYIQVHVKEIERYRDGGTIKYVDDYGRIYYQWWGNKRIFDQYPTREAKDLKPFEDLPEESIVKEIKVQLIVQEQ